MRGDRLCLGPAPASKICVPTAYPRPRIHFADPGETDQPPFVKIFAVLEQPLSDLDQRVFQTTGRIGRSAGDLACEWGRRLAGLSLWQRDAALNSQARTPALP
jgi:hypothetical protein